MRNTKPIATALAVTLGALTFASTAQAGDPWGGGHRYHRGGHGGNAAAAGIFGFAAGAIIGGALSGPRYYGNGYYGDDYYDGGYYAPRYRQPRVVYVEPAPVYVQRSRAHFEPWTPEWYAYCDARYQSFNPETGYFKGYDRKFHLCR